LTVEIDYAYQQKLLGKSMYKGISSKVTFLVNIAKYVYSSHV